MVDVLDVVRNGYTPEGYKTKEQQVKILGNLCMFGQEQCKHNWTIATAREFLTYLFRVTRGYEKLPAEEDVGDIVERFAKKVSAPIKLSNICDVVELEPDAIIVMHSDIPPHKWDGKKFIKIEFEGEQNATDRKE